MTARRTSELAIGALPIALVLALWQGLAASGLAPPSLLPAPMAVFARLAEQLGNPTFLEHAATTLFRLFAGFAIAVGLRQRPILQQTLHDPDWPPDIFFVHRGKLSRSPGCSVTGTPCAARC